MLILGVINKDKVFTDISRSEKGCKKYATKNGFSLVGFRDADHYHVTVTHKKEGKKWVKV